MEQITFMKPSNWLKELVFKSLVSCWTSQIVPIRFAVMRKQKTLMFIKAALFTSVLYLYNPKYFKPLVALIL